MSENRDAERSFNYMSMFLTIIIIAAVILVGFVIYQRSNTTPQITEVRTEPAPAPAAPVIVNPAPAPAAAPVIINQQPPAAAPASEGGQQSVTINQPAPEESESESEPNTSSDSQSTSTDTSSTKP